MCHIEDGSNYLHNLDFEPMREYFDILKVGDGVTEDIRDMICAVHGHVWNIHEPGDYSLYGATVAYFGQNTPDLHTLDWFDDVMIVNLSPHSKLLGGRLIFYFKRRG